MKPHTQWTLWAALIVGTALAVCLFAVVAYALHAFVYWGRP